MKLSGRQIADFLAQPKQALGALVYGADEGLVRERIQAVKFKLLPQGADAFSFAEVTDDAIKAEPSRLADECAALSLMGGNRIVFLRDAADRHTKAVEAALPLLHPGCFLLVGAGELAARSSLRLLFETEKTLAALPCYHDETENIQALIRARLEKEGLSVAREAVEYLTAHLGNDRGVTLAELEKLALYTHGRGIVAFEDAQALIEGNRETQLDSIAFAVAERNAAALDAQLRQALQEGAQPVALLRAAQRHFQRLYAVAAAREGGASLDQAVGALKPPVFFKQQPVIKRQAGAWSRAQAARALKRLREAEAACKSTGVNVPLECSAALLALASHGAAQTA